MPAINGAPPQSNASWKTGSEHPAHKTTTTESSAEDPAPNSQSIETQESPAPASTAANSTQGATSQPAQDTPVATPEVAEQDENNPKDLDYLRRAALATIARATHESLLEMMSESPFTPLEAHTDRATSSYDTGRSAGSETPRQSVSA